MRSLAGALTLVGLAAFGLSGCSSGGGGLAAQACGNVTRALSYERDATTSSGNTAKTLELRADRQLELAEPLAAQAAGANGSWQALQATLAEVTRVRTTLLVPALKAECSRVAAGGA